MIKRKLNYEDCNNLVKFCYNEGYIDLAEKIRDGKLYKMLQPKFRMRNAYD